MLLISFPLALICGLANIDSTYLRNVCDVLRDYTAVSSQRKVLFIDTAARASNPKQRVATLHAVPVCLGYMPFCDRVTGQPR